MALFALRHCLLWHIMRVLVMRCCCAELEVYQLKSMDVDWVCQLVGTQQVKLQSIG